MPANWMVSPVLPFVYGVPMANKALQRTRQPLCAMSTEAAGVARR